VALALQGRAVQAYSKPEARLALTGADLKAFPFAAYCNYHNLLKPLPTMPVARQQGSSASF
jgi:hypothetical protein